MLALLAEVDVLFPPSDDVVLLLIIPFETLLVLDKVPISLTESDREGEDVGESFGERRLKNEASRRRVDARSL